MKGKFSFVVASLLLVSNSVFAAPSVIIAFKQANFAPVEWHATMQNGGFGIQNQTGKFQHVQVAIKSGEIYVYTVRGNTLGSCKQDLNADTGPYSVVCDLAPNDVLAADLDFAKMTDATGTYQVKM